MTSKRKQRGIESTRSYTFRDYFEMGIPALEIFHYFGYRYERRLIDFPTYTDVIPWLYELQQWLKEGEAVFEIVGEAGRRESLIAPVLIKVGLHLKGRVETEALIDAGPQLKGTVDYLLKKGQQMVVIEAKRGDLDQAFVQLGTELIALAHLDTHDTPRFYGAVSTGTIWQFGFLDRAEQVISADGRVYGLGEIEQVVRILLGILT